MESKRIPDVRTRFERVNAELVREAGKLAAAILADVYGRRGTLHGRIQPLLPSMKVASLITSAFVISGEPSLAHGRRLAIQFSFTCICPFHINAHRVHYFR